MSPLVGPEAFGTSPDGPHQPALEFSLNDLSSSWCLSAVIPSAASGALVCRASASWISQQAMVADYGFLVFCGLMH